MFLGRSLLTRRFVAIYSVAFHEKHGFSSRVVGGYSPSHGNTAGVDVSRMPMLEVLAHVERELAEGATRVELDVLDPDKACGLYAGELTAGGVRSRSLRTWIDLAERLSLRLCMPRPLESSLVRLTFERLDAAARVRSSGEATERYGTESEFARISKLEDPSFVIDLTEALARVVEAARGGEPARDGAMRVLDLGVNTGDELALMLARVPSLRGASFVGIDHSASAIEHARGRFAGVGDIQLLVADVNTLPTLELGRFDLVISIGTLQSPGIDDRELLRRIVQDHLTPTGAVIIGMPNCRYIDGEVEYGARIKNLSEPELGLVIKDVAFYRKYLQQHHRQVFVTGKHYLLVTGVVAAAPS